MKCGIYKHYSGKLYQVMGVCRHSETLEEMIVYQALYDNYGLWVRPKAMFFEKVDMKDKETARFSFVGPSLVEPPILK